MSKVPVVHINTEYVQRFLTENGISGAAFSRSLGYSDHWWMGVQHQGKGVKPNVVRLMCNLYKLDEAKLIVKPAAPEQPAKPETLTVDGEVVEAFGKWLERVETKLDKLLSIWG